MFFDTNTGQYVRRDAVNQRWIPDPHTFPGMPTRPFEQQQETGTLPEYEHPTDEAAFDTPDTVLAQNPNLQSQRSQSFPDLRGQTAEERADLLESQIWVHIGGASDSHIRQKVEDIFADPGGWQEQGQNYVRINEGLVGQSLGDTSAEVQNEIAAQHTRFLTDVRAFNRNAIQQGSKIPVQPETGLTPDGVLVAVANTPISIQSIGFSEGARYYMTSSGWEVSVDRTTPESFDVTAVHPESGASISITNIPEAGTSVVNTRSGHMLDSVLDVYRAAEKFQNGEEQIAVNAFDNAAILASEYVYKYVNDPASLNALQSNNPNIDMRVDAFVESPQVLGPTSDRLMDNYQSRLKEEMSESEQAQVLARLKSLETQRRNIQDGMETAVGNYRRQQNILESMLVQAGVTINVRPVMDMEAESVTPPRWDRIRNAVHRSVTNNRVADSLLKIVDSLEQQLVRITNTFPREIDRVGIEIYRVKRANFKDAVFGRYRHGSPERTTENVAFAYLSQYLNQDEMSGLLLNPGTRGAASASFDYRWDVDESHPGYGLILDANAFAIGASDMTLSSILDSESLNELIRSNPEIRSATNTQMGAEAFTVAPSAENQLDFEQSGIRGIYTFNNNPFIQIQVISQQSEYPNEVNRMQGAANLPARPRGHERVMLVVEPRIPQATRRGERVMVDIEIENSQETEQERIRRMPQLVEQFALANYNLLTDFVNPISRNRISVESSTGTTTYRITDTLKATVRPTRRNTWTVALTDGENTTTHTVDAEDVTGFWPQNMRYAALQSATMEALSDLNANAWLQGALRTSLMSQSEATSRAASDFMDIAGVATDEPTRVLIERAILQERGAGVEYSSTDAAITAASRAATRYRTIAEDPMGPKRETERLVDVVYDAYASWRRHEIDRIRPIDPEYRTIDQETGTMGATQRTEEEMQGAVCRIGLTPYGPNRRCEDCYYRWYATPLGRSRG